MKSIKRSKEHLNSKRTPYDITEMIRKVMIIDLDGLVKNYAEFSMKNQHI